KARIGVRHMAKSLLSMLRGKPEVTVHDLSPSDLLRWKAAMKDNHRKIISEIGGRAGEIYQAMIAGRDKYRKDHP
ncbi:hypothetical protein MNBD_ALPHA02-1987, partial [hydrothermal vent metagenome]